MRLAVDQPPPQHQLVLAGGGHSHALLLRRWCMRPEQRPAATAITLVNRHSTAFYSGRVPALVAGLLAPEDCTIDLRRLCGLAGVSFVQAEIIGLDLKRQDLGLAGRPALRWDRLSLDLGAVTAHGGWAATAHGAGAMPVKPLEPFLVWVQQRQAGEVVRIRGGGAAAVELALALRSRGLTCRLLLRGTTLQLGSAAANRRGEQVLAEAGIVLERQVPEAAQADLACTGSRAPSWLARSGLPVEPTSGRVLTEASLAVLGHPRVFASGDCGLIATAPRPASGVWAVRAAPRLASNLRRSLEQPGRPLQAWRPQGRALQLLGDGGWQPTGPRALASWGPWVLGPSRWLWHWKERIDRRFMAGFLELGSEGRRPAMACRGCAAKLAAAPLAAALARLNPQATGPGPAEDAALLGTTAEGELLLQSVDGFPALLSDPWLNARLTTLHACSDLWASGAQVDSAQALVTVPAAAAGLQEELLLQTLAGVRSVLDPLGARLIGGHTLEGRDGAGLALALTVNGRTPPERHWPKGPLRPGDALLLCGPLGTGVLFAAAMAGAASPSWIEGALERMQHCQAPLVELLAAHGCSACTDITGFGLLGHLGEMVASSVSPEALELRVILYADAIRALPGALELLEQGWASTLAPSNGQALALLEGPIQLRRSAGSPLRALLIDPQTCGPLLAALPAQRAEAALEALRSAGFHDAALIAQVATTMS